MGLGNWGSGVYKQGSHNPKRTSDFVFVRTKLDSFGCDSMILAFGTNL